MLGDDVVLSPSRQKFACNLQFQPKLVQFSLRKFPVSSMSELSPFGNSSTLEQNRQNEAESRVFGQMTGNCSKNTPPPPLGGVPPKSARIAPYLLAGKKTHALGHAILLFLRTKH